MNSGFNYLNIVCGEFTKIDSTGLMFAANVVSEIDRDILENGKPIVCSITFKYSPPVLGESIEGILVKHNIDATTCILSLFIASPTPMQQVFFWVIIDRTSATAYIKRIVSTT